ncbi:FtsK/SpoIIIE domain-containing protein [Amycolatopsis jiangsuensis]|uniref:S-DNA-T family DNA segregation ATPase FtsK/SpoIIIE n=1 Tax=Amycolatopsis jiangsuensis TaxID=1181879 RepID=A0A840ISX4_9PSEU|nr:FtsK/SpoIIIE domain-containing protein [Amycolatopsis jiangsuensis]MBB4684639.1 S-DNA-T family DNA segregation ATPase FtsK/SpoIIIE [Amycolatopsis jiangsuensis]
MSAEPERHEENHAALSPTGTQDVEHVGPVLDGELIDDTLPQPRTRAASGRRTKWWRTWCGASGRLWRSGPLLRARSVAAYRARKAPLDVVRLIWFVLRGNGRWLVKFWNWATYADLRADARRARLAGDSEARRTAQELIRSDATARWAKVGIALRRCVITLRVAAPVVALLWLVDSVMDRADMWPWLAQMYADLTAVWSALTVVIPVVLVLAPIAWAVAAAFEGRDRAPGAGWLVRPDRADADSWIDERMISKALAHLGISPLDRFYKDGGELAYTVVARKDGDGTFAQIRLPLGVTADMVAARRSKLAANLGRASLETWPTKGDEDGLLDLWVADKGVLQGGAGAWPLVHEGQVDVFEGVPFGLSQRGQVINAPLVGVNWLIGGRPGQGKSAALRTLLLGAALDPTAELWAFVMGESPDFDPFAPRLTRYRMGMDDSVAEAATQALADLLSEMERRGRVLGEQPGRPPKVSRKLADKRGLGLHPLVCGIDECHELFQHPKYGKKAAELAVRLIKRGRKYGIVLLLATQSPTKDSIPREITRNVSCGVAFSVADQVANDGLLGSGKYSAGIRATELRINTDRGTCVAVGITDETFELVRTFYVPFEDGADDVTPVIARAMELIEEAGREIEAGARPQIETAAPVAVDHLADIAAVCAGEKRVRTQVVLARLIARNPEEYDGWTLRDLTAALAAHGLAPAKSDGNKVIRADDLAAALADRQRAGADESREEDRDSAGSQGLIPDRSLTQSPWTDQRKHDSGTAGTQQRDISENPRQQGGETTGPDSLPGDADGS